MPKYLVDECFVDLSTRREGDYTVLPVKIDGVADASVAFCRQRSDVAQNQGGPEVGRRGFLGYVVGGIGAAIAAAVAVPVIGYFFSPASQKTKPLVTPIGNTSEIPIGVPTRLTYEQRVCDGWYVTTLSKAAWVVTTDGRNFVAYDPRCTHLNCPYYWDDQKKEFLCPCHSGRFDINGSVLGGPPPRPLDRLGLEIQQGSIILTGTSTRKG